MAGSRGRWTSDTLTAGSLLRPKQVAKAVFHPAWIPESVDPSVERLKRVRIVAGAVAAFGVYTFVQGRFDFTEVLENMLTASAVLLFITPLTVGVMLFVWRRTGTVRQLRSPLLNSLKLLLLFIGLVVLTVFLWQLSTSLGGIALALLGLTALWLTGFLVYGAVQLSGNFFGSAAVHRCLPPLLATVTTWLMAIPDLVTGDLHGLSFTMGIVFILGAPVTVTAIAALEMNRLRRRYGIRLGAHPATLPAPRPAGPPAYPPPGFVPPWGAPSGPGNPYAPHPHGSPSGPFPQGGPYAPHHQGNPPAPGTRQNPYGRGPYGS
ncbi:proline-rich domain-containing protein [Streptomyces sp. NBC_00645]|uniref:proline-rich domain-containing protein n=1 Tax=Streptomyces sp. NBC_00645 TaxID=2975795 RepID=UPI003254ABC5